MLEINMPDKILYKPIGVIHTPYTKKEDTPIQGCFSPKSRGYVELFPEYVAGLKNVGGFSHLILIYHFHKAEGFKLLTKPFLDKEKRGIFAIRHFNRPNPIGLSIVKLLKVKGTLLEIGEVDMLDGTPLLDIKPYVPQFDIKEHAKDGWYPSANERTKHTITE
jgi:tRNA-Thr(GGU) m(6)t(6)A37 methyltransferase TsaA